MAIKTIKYTVDISGVAPATEQFAGMQGDHRVTKVEFMIDDQLGDAITDYAAETNGKAMYRFDVYDGEGGIWQSEASELESYTVGIELEERHTRYGGKVEVYLVLTGLSADNGTEIELYNFPVTLRLKNRPEGEYQYGENRESVAGLVEVAKQKAAEAAASVEATESINKEVQDFAAEIEEKLVNGEYKGEKGDTGPQGPQGEKGDAGKDAVTDQSYSPTSENAQSGVAVAEAVAKCVQKVKSNGHTYQVYAVGSADVGYNDAMLDVEDNSRFVYENEYGTIPRRQGNGNLYTNPPVEDLDCANKKYVDDLVGDIEAALDELHNYAQAIIGGVE